MAHLASRVILALAAAAWAARPAPCQAPTQEPTPAPAPAPVGSAERGELHELGVFFWHDSPNDEAAFVGIRAGLQAAGIRCRFVERRADSDEERAGRQLAELRAAGCELVFAMGTRATLLAAAALDDVPVVFAAVSDPVASGVVDGWQGSGRALAGGTNRIPPATLCRVFGQAVPGLRRLGMLRSATSGVVSAAELANMREYLATAAAPRVEVVEATCADAAGLGRATRELVAAGVDAIWVPIDFTVYQHLAAVRAVADAARVPLVATAHNGARDGAVVGVTVDFELHGRRVAALAARVLAGAAPGDLPVDTMQSYVIVANLDAAARIGHELPLSLLVKADTLLRAQDGETGRDGR